MIVFVGLRPKTYSHLMDGNSEHKKAKGTRKCVRKRILKFNDHDNRLFKNKIILKSKQDLTVKGIVCILNKSIRLH